MELEERACGSPNEEKGAQLKDLPEKTKATNIIITCNRVNYIQIKKRPR